LIAHAAAPSTFHGKLCRELELLTKELGDAPCLSQLAEWIAKSRGSAHFHVDTLVALGLVDKVTRRRSGTRGGIVEISLTDTGRALARSHPEGHAGALRKLSPKRSVFAPGTVRGTHVLIVELDDCVMTQCTKCKYESAMIKRAWATCPRPCPSCRGTAIDPHALEKWLANVPSEHPPTAEERDEMLDLVLEEIGQSPFTELERFALATTYATEHAPGQTFTLEQVSLVLGVTRERVRQIERNALETLKARLRRSGAATDIIESLREIDATRVGEE
jgi:DNA-binding MarR family transcriptional regulator